jgi:3-deoxy-manno-octulosonate cytidylyltransferase (CMP-KDO synthetase)
MDVIGIIPARYASTRFEGKVLADIFGKPMIQHVWERAKRATLLEDLIVACDDERIKKTVEEFGGKVVITAKGHLSGTDRLTEIVNPLEIKIVVNIQADEPLIHPSMIDGVARALLDNSTLNMATLMKCIEDKSELNNPNVVKVVTDKDGFALYFSRATIPYLTPDTQHLTPNFYKHIGLYAYTKDFLFTFTNLPQGRLERKEKLEQLRALENGYRIKVIETKFNTIGIDTPEDLEKVRSYLKTYETD